MWREGEREGQLGAKTKGTVETMEKNSGCKKGESWEARLRITPNNECMEGLGRGRNSS